MEKSRQGLDTVSENIRILGKRAKMTRKQTDICIEQLCQMAINDNDDIHAVWDMFCENAVECDAYCGIMLCKMICEDIRYAPALVEMSVFGDTEDIGASAKNRIAYVRNKRNDKLFLDFSDRIKGAKAHYATSFSDACEAVFNGACEYCILPVENNKDGKLYSFYSMMDRYELKIVQVIREDSEDGTESTVFALAARSLVLSAKSAAGQMFEFSVINENADFISDVIMAVNALGGKLADVGTQPVPYDQPRRKYYFTVDPRGASAVPLALYMTMKYAGYTPVGLYNYKNK